MGHTLANLEVLTSTHVSCVAPVTTPQDPNFSLLGCF
jgi:hypothetical protein